RRRNAIADQGRSPDAVVGVFVGGPEAVHRGAGGVDVDRGAAVVAGAVRRAIRARVGTVAGGDQHAPLQGRLAGALAGGVHRQVLVGRWLQVRHAEVARGVHVGRGEVGEDARAGVDLARAGQRDQGGRVGGGGGVEVVPAGLGDARVGVGVHR